MHFSFISTEHAAFVIDGPNLKHINFVIVLVSWRECLLDSTVY